jgi:ectoine hydroxylase-related dioxygenase (phytanoyl-CoA dioxygenase family)
MTVLAEIGCDYPTAGLLRPISAEEKLAYARDGAAIVRGVIPPDWVAFMRDAVDRMMGRTDSGAQNYAADGRPRFFAQTFPWRYDETFKAWAVRSPLVEVARQVLTDPSVLFFYDQIFAKEPGDTVAVPWHQDFSYLPLQGDQMVRLWVPFDRVTVASGAIHYLRGSHRWGVTYNPIGFKDIATITDTYVDSPFQDIPDFDSTYDQYDWMIAEAEPGDLLLHHPLTVHGSRGNTTSGYRRALTNFYVGSSTVWHPHRANMFNNKSLTGHVAPPELRPGGPILCDMFPVVA